MSKLKNYYENHFLGLGGLDYAVKQTEERSLLASFMNYFQKKFMRTYKQINAKVMEKRKKECWENELVISEQWKYVTREILKS